MLAFSIFLVIRKMGPLFRLMQTQIDTVNRILREQITGIRVVRAFVREPYETARFARANTELTSTTTSVGRYVASIFPIVMFILNVFSVAVLWFGARRIDTGEMQIGALTAFLTYLIQILMSVMMATFLLITCACRRLCRADYGCVEHRVLGGAATASGRSCRSPASWRSRTQSSAIREPSHPCCGTSA